MQMHIRRTYTDLLYIRMLTRRRCQLATPWFATGIIHTFWIHSVVGPVEADYVQLVVGHSIDNATRTKGW